MSLPTIPGLLRGKARCDVSFEGSKAHVRSKKLQRSSEITLRLGLVVRSTVRGVVLGGPYSGRQSMGRLSGEKFWERAAPCSHLFPTHTPSRHPGSARVLGRQLGLWLQG